MRQLTLSFSWPKENDLERSKSPMGVNDAALGELFGDFWVFRKVVLLGVFPGIE